MITLAIGLLAIAPQGTPLRFTLLEDFEQAGTSWLPTLFPLELIPGGAAFTREPLTVAQGAPSTVPPLPINAGGDLEGRYAEVTPSGGSYALMADTPANQLADGGVRAFVAIGAPDPFGSQSVGVLVRASVNPNPPFGTGVNAYTAEVIRNGTGSLLFSVARWRDSIITPADVFQTVPFTGDVTQENYIISLRAEEDLLVARLWRVFVDDGALVTSPVVLNPLVTGAAANTLVARDDELPSGRVGVHGFARGGNSVFWDDVQLGLPADRVGPVLAPLGSRSGQRPVPPGQGR